MYKLVVGLEIHTELNTNTKAFSSAKNSYSLEENIFVSPVDLAFPGTLPVFNLNVLEKAIKLVKILNMHLSTTVMFDRKNYFYPDLPKGYQITQETLPIGISGEYELLNGKVIGINNIHMEEDTASLDHYDKFTLMDYNRCGVPLIEIVTEPDFRNTEDVMSFLEDLRLILKNANISNADSTKGQIRVDVNVSVMEETDNDFGTRVELKNINSFNVVKKAIECEMNRQVSLLKNGYKIKQETRRYDEELNETVLLRSKEDSIDYRYFIDANIPSFTIPDSFIKSSIKDIPELPNELLKKYVNEYCIDEINAKKIIKDINLCKYFEKLVKNDIDPIMAINLITGPISEYLNKSYKKISEYTLKEEDLIKLIKLNENGNISSKQLKEIILNIDLENLSIEEFIKKHKMEQVNNTEDIIKIINIVLYNNKSKVNEYKEGKTNLYKYFIGEIMKESKGKINPVLANQELEKILNEVK